ncbi:MAG: apocarotenoid-15,15'-oxygenase, partial [Pirellulaceae bacterium]|nr:apocarotenoid-15,15'-oxygenase [Pirellulaceae bacterium]
MKTQIHHRFASGLPSDDTHPYRTGPWRPQCTEYDAWDLEVEGRVPEDLNGVYIRNTENPTLPPIARYHPFDGDGMLHSIVFQAGEATYRNRFIRTEGFLAEQAARESLWSGIIEDPNAARRPGGWGARTRMKDASSTDVVIHRGVAISSFWQCGDLY